MRFERAGSLPESPASTSSGRTEPPSTSGKAVDLRSRVRSYADPRSARIRRMVDRAGEIEIAVTDTETQALLLEANLIKRHQPRYNVRLWGRQVVSDGPVDGPRRPADRDHPRSDESATVFGPYTSKTQVETVVKALRETYGVRGCSDHKYAGRERPCLDYEMGLCTAPCTREIDLESYAQDVTAVERFLEGETGILTDPLRREMEAAAESQNFERAANLRDRLETVAAFHGEGGEAVQSTGDEGCRRARRRHRGRGRDRRPAARRARQTDRPGSARSRHSSSAGVDTDGAADGVPSVLAAFIVQYYAERELPDALLLPERHGDDEVAAWLEAEGSPSAFRARARRRNSSNSR